MTTPIVWCLACGGPGRIERDWRGEERIACDVGTPCDEWLQEMANDLFWDIWGYSAAEYPYIPTADKDELIDDMQVMAEELGCPLRPMDYHHSPAALRLWWQGSQVVQA